MEVVEKFKNSLFFSIRFRRYHISTVQMVNRKDFGDLVVIVANLERIKQTKDFLDSVGFAQKEVYIGDTLRKLDLSSVSDGDLYVCTPEEAFRYQKNGSNVSTIETRIDEFNSKGTISEAVKYIGRLANINRNAGKQTSIHVLFFEDESKRNFERRIYRHHFELSLTSDLLFDNDHVVSLYNYKT